MKKLFSLLLVFIFIFSLSSCSSQSTQDTNEDTLNIVVTSFPAYEWTCEIIGEENTDYSITLLADGSDPHSFQPSAQDIIKITSCDILIYTGGTSDEWIEKAIDEGENDNLHTIVLMDVLSDRLLPVEYIPGMQHDHDEHDEHDDHDGAPDEHVWLSLTNAMLCTDAITDALCEVDENNKDTYIKNADEYKKELLSLDEQYRDMVTSSPRDTVLFSDRFPFTYLFNDYNLKYYAAFAGCSSQNEASFETVAFLNEKASELDLDVVLTIDGSDGKLAQTIVENSVPDAKILVLNSMQTASGKDIDAGTSYIDMMKENLSVLSKALS